MQKVLIVLALTAIVLAACGPSPVATATNTPAATELPAATPTATGELPATDGQPSAPAPSETPTAAGPVSFGPNPEDFPAGINPLTGLPANDASLLNLPAVLISVTNFPASARPQAGLSFAAMIYEIYIGEGTTRFLAVFYGDAPKATVPGASGALVDYVGPVRSGRLPYVDIRDAFQWSCLVYASATAEIRAQLRGCHIVFGTDANDINSAFVDVTRMKELAQANLKPGEPFNYTGNLFGDTVPSGGQAASTLKIYYSLLNQAMWTYDGASGKYLRSENNPSAADQFTPATDRLTGQPLAFSNVIVMFADHKVVKPTIIDIDLSLGNGGTAYLFRDGQVFPIRWSTIGGDYEKQTGLRRPIQFTDEAGNPIALQPGSTWVHVMTPFSTVTEESAGAWLARFFAPAGSQ